MKTGLMSTYATVHYRTQLQRSDACCITSNLFSWCDRGFRQTYNGPLSHNLDFTKHHSSSYRLLLLISHKIELQMGETACRQNPHNFFPMNCIFMLLWRVFTLSLPTSWFTNLEFQYQYRYTRLEEYRSRLICITK